MSGHLQYNSFTVVWLHVFSSDAPIAHAAQPDLIAPYRCALDRQIFDASFLRQENSLRRYKLAGFNIDVHLTEDEAAPTIRGTVHVEAALYFGAAVSVTYRLVVAPAQSAALPHAPGEAFCLADKPLDSDHLIILAGIPVGIEHWHLSSEERGGDSSDQTGRATSIDLMPARLRISGLRLSKDGRPLTRPGAFHGGNEVLVDVFRRYQKFLTSGASGTPPSPTRDDSTDSLYTLIDVWEDVSHSGDSLFTFAHADAPSIISHIVTQHKSELMGLLTLYPYEWPYRDERYFDRVCGENIAIDTDDLVLASDNVCVVFGTYGLRGAGSPTDWATVLKDRVLDHVSWPEYLYILDMAVAKLHTIKATLSGLLSTATVTTGTRSNDIKRNSQLALITNRVILNLDALMFSRFQAHKLMYRLTEQRLGVEKEMRVLRDAMAQFDSCLKTIDSMEEAKRGRMVKALLAYIAVASVFGVVFLNTEIPLIRDLVSRAAGRSSAMVVLSMVITGLIGFALVTTARWVWAVRIGRLEFWRRRRRS